MSFSDNERKQGARKHRKRQARIAGTRTANKIARVLKTELDRAFHTELAGIKRLRDDELAQAGAEYRKALTVAKDIHTAARGEIYKRYDERRDVILKTLAPQDERVAA